MGLGSGDISSDRAIEGVQFSVAAQAAWAPGLETHDEWLAWAQSPFLIEGKTEPRVAMMPAMLRRRAGLVGKMALEVAYDCLNKREQVPTIFSSRHGECARSAELLQDLVQNTPLSPTSFSLSVHNATAGLLSIARQEQVSHSALSAGDSGVEHAVIEACGLLADGATEVLLVVYDGLLPDQFKEFDDCKNQPFAWAWLMQPARDGAMKTVSLSWDPLVKPDASDGANLMPPISNHATGKLPQPGGLQVLAFELRQDRELIRLVDNRMWRWRHNDQ
ncbi:beta-ketoacyl synthase chain length factor [Glaciimonas immobilis]|nr:beta-ketoacyl synthase chain length factor [Glaciimonas immobilis]